MDVKYIQIKNYLLNYVRRVLSNVKYLQVKKCLPNEVKQPSD